MTYDIAIIAKNAGNKLASLVRLSDTGLQGDDYAKALRMLEAGLSFSYTNGAKRIALIAA